MGTLLGVVTGKINDKRGEPVAWVTPLVEIATWRAVSPDEFPTQGSLFWPKANDAVHDGLVFVRAKENPFRPQGFKDEFVVADPHPALEVLDLRTLGDLDHIRADLTAGLSLPAGPLGRCLIWCSGNVVVGPVGLVASPNGTTIEKNNRDRIKCFQLKDGDIRAVSYGGLTRHVYAKTNLGTPDRYVDWDDDKQVVRRAIENAVLVSMKRGSAVDRAKQLIEEASEHFTKEGSKAEIQLAVYRLERTRELIKADDQVNALASEIADSLKKHPAIAQELEALKVAERQIAKADAEASLKSEHAELARLGNERAAAEADLREATTAIEKAKAEGARKAEEVEKQVRDRIDEVIQSAPALLAEIAVLKPFLGGTTPPVSRPRAIVSYSYPRWKVGPIALSSVKELRSRIVPILKASGIPGSTYQRVHAAFAAKLLPVLAGPRALDALKAYAQVATGGRVSVVQVTTVLAEAGDVFGRVDSARGRFVPHPAGLIDVLLAAQESEGLMLVVLDGANRGATESYLLPLLRSALRRTSPVSLFHPSAVTTNDPYSGCSRVVWPENLLLAATLVEGPTTLPVAPDIWADSIFIASDGAEMVQAVPTATASTELSEIDPKSALLALGKSAESTSGGALDGVVKLHALQEAAIRFERALSVFQSDQAALQVEVSRAVLVPFLASIANDDDRAGAIADVEKNLGAKASAGLQEAIVSARRRIA